MASISAAEAAMPFPDARPFKANAYIPRYDFVVESASRNAQPRRLGGDQRIHFGVWHRIARTCCVGAFRGLLPQPSCSTSRSATRQ
jgi:hypothetical protein